MARVITGLAARGMRHSIACLRGTVRIGNRFPADTEFHCLHSRPNEPQLPARLAGLIRRIRPTVIHARNWGAWPDVAIGRLLTRPIVPLIFSFHGLGEVGYVRLRRRLISRILARMTTFLFTVSEQSRHMLVSEWGWPDGKVAVIRNGVDTRQFRPAAVSCDSALIAIGTVGTLRSVKNQALLIRACAKLVRRGIDLELWVAGEGEERERLLALAESLAFADRLKLAGRVEDVPRFLRRLDVFVLSSDSEQHPNALNEAMACGVACVATRVGCVEELLDNGRCGRIIPPGDVDGLVAALNELIADPELRARLASAAVSRVCRHYSLTRMIEAYSHLYERLSFARTRPGCGDSCFAESSDNTQADP